MDKLDKLILIKIREQWGASPFPSSGEGWNNGAYTPSIPIKDRRDINDEEEEEEEEEEEKKR